MSVSSLNGGHPVTDQGRGPSSPTFAVVSSTHFESGPPISKIPIPNEDGEIIETVQEEEWEERRRKTTTKTRNVERRVQRQLVLEDGEVVGDSGAVITENATEDVVVKEDISDQNLRPEGQLALPPPSLEGWGAAPGAVVISEKSTKTTKSHEEVEDELETEEVVHCGDVTNQEVEAHVEGRGDIRQAAQARSGTELVETRGQPKVVREATRRRGTIDTEDVHETSQIQDGRVVTETRRATRQERYDNESLPDSGSTLSDGSAHETAKTTAHNLVHTKDEDLLEYYAIPKGGTLAQGVKIGEGMHVVSEDVHEDRQGEDERVDATQGETVHRRGTAPTTGARRDAFTKRPLDYEQEDETRRSETNRWLESHFGSESGRSEDSNRDSEDRVDGTTMHSAGGNRITITMSPPSGASPPRAPPQPPPKPERVWSRSPERHVSPPRRGGCRRPPEIKGTELVTARSRLRSTGLSLTDDDKENDAPSQGAPCDGAPTINLAPSLKDDIIYSSRFRSGRPKGRAPLAPGPPTLTSVGRSQSFHVPLTPSTSGREALPRERLKDCRSEERLDAIVPRGGHRHFEKTWSPTNEPTPPPPPRMSRRGPPVEAATQTVSGPIPPPRTKRKKRPKSSYFFGDNASPTRPRVSFNGCSSPVGERRSSPPAAAVEKRYKATKTITPVLVVPLSDRGTGPPETWTRTLDLRRRPRIGRVPDEDRSTTLPRKMSQYPPKKTYLFGETGGPRVEEDTRSMRDGPPTRNHVYDGYSLNRRLEAPAAGRPVGRSRSFNIQQVDRPTHRAGEGALNGRPLADTEELSGSTPYLRSPNLIATIARRRDSGPPEAPPSPSSEEKRQRFMKGLLNTAPELFHFIHGAEGPVRENHRREARSPSPQATQYSARVFTFGKSDHDTLTRTPAHLRDTTRARQQHSEGNERRSTFNLKASGSSLLYSPSFRSLQQEAEDRRRSPKGDRGGMTPIGGGIPSSHRSPVIVPVRDWNMR